VLIAGYIRRPTSLAQAARDIICHPIQNAFLLVWLISMLVVGWGVLSEGRLSWSIATQWGQIQSWQLGGIVAFVCLGLLFACSAYEGHVYRKRLEEGSREKSNDV
jgi:hypothetical protein